MRKPNEREFLGHIIYALTLSSLVFVHGCCFPGDGMTQSGVRGRLLYEDGEPVPNEEIQFLVPAFYWKSCLTDEEPMYNTVVTYTEEDGSFSCVFRPETSPATICFIPPMAIPGYPCKPNFAVFLPNRAENGVVTKYGGKKIKCRQVQIEPETLRIQEQYLECEQIKMTGEACRSDFSHSGEDAESAWGMRGWLADVDIVIAKKD